MKFLSILTLLFLSPVLAIAENWQLYSYYEDGGYTYLDADSIRREGELVHYALKKQYESLPGEITDEQQEASRKAGGQVDYEISRYALKCQIQEYTLTERSWYQLNHSLIRSEAFPLQWQSFLNASHHHALNQNLCSEESPQ